MAFIDEVRVRFGVEPVCRVLTEHGVQIAPRTYYAAKTRPPSTRSVRDDRVLTEIRRIHADPQTAEMRPSLTHLGGSVEEIEKLLSDREPLYRQVMTGELDVTYLTPEDAVVYIVRLL